MSSGFGGYDDSFEQHFYLNYTVAFAHPGWGDRKHPEYGERALYKSVIFEPSNGDQNDVLLRIDRLEQQVAEMQRIIDRLTP